MVAILLALAGMAGPAHAALPPISEEELTKMAEIIVTGQVASVACGEVVERQAGQTTWQEIRFISTIYVTGKVKGEPPMPLHYQGIRQVFTGEPLVGPAPSPPLPMGWAGKLYLSAAGGGRYEATYDGSTPKEDPGLSKPQPLPTCPATDGGVGDAGSDGSRGADSASGGDGGTTKDGPASDAGTDAADKAGSESGCSCALGRKPARSGGAGILLAVLAALLGSRRGAPASRRRTRV